MADTTAATGAAPGAVPDVHAREIHPAAIRWMHWVNFPLLGVMAWSGLRIYWADDVYAFGVGSVELFHFFPQWFYEWLDLDFHLARGLAFHFTFAWLFTVNGCLYGLYLWRSGHWRRLVPDRRGWREAALHVLHDVGLRSESPPQGRYNAAQQITYVAVIGLGALAVVSGLAIYKPTQLAPLTGLLGGYRSARLIHFAVTIGFMSFVVVHVVQVARAGVGNLVSMVTGYRPVTDRGGEGDSR